MLHKLRLLRLFGHQEWIRHGVRNRVLYFFVNPYKIRSHAFEVDFFGLKYRGNLNTYVDWVLYFYGVYEKAELSLLSDLLKGRTDTVAVDVGSNVGHHTLFLSQYCKEVHAFEPYGPVSERLIHNISLNSIKNITVHDVGLGSEDTEITFYAPTDNNSGTGSFLARYSPTNTPFRKLRTVKGDEYFAQHRIRRVDLIKIDVEGFEKEVLRGLQNTLAVSRPMVLMEFTPATRDRFSDFEEFRRLLPDHYRFFKVKSDRQSYWLSEFVFAERHGNVLMLPE